MKRLGLLVAGVQKAATTTLHGMLSTLPGLAGPVGRKELHFFDDDAATDWRQPDYAPLHAAFAGAPADATWFESTPATLFWPGALARVRDYNPAMKLVLVFRDPVERAVSAWRMERARGVEPLGFAEALAAEDARCAGAGGGLRQFAYRRRGLYGAQLEAALALFPREQLLLLRFEDVVGQPDETLARIARFAGVAEPGGPVTPQRLNAGASTALAEPEALAALADAYREDLIRFLELSRLEIAHWRSFVLAREGRHAATTDAMGLPRRDDPRQHAVPVCSHGPVFGNLVLLLRGGRRHPVPNAECLTAHGYRFPEDVVAVDDRVLLSCVPAQPLGRSLRRQYLARHVATPRRGGKDKLAVGQGGLRVRIYLCPFQYFAGAAGQYLRPVVGPFHLGRDQPQFRQAEILHRPGGGAHIFTHLGVGQDDGGSGHLRL